MAANVPSRKEPINVLVVDDEQGFRNLLQWELGSRGMNVDVAPNGVEAVQKLKEKPFDLVITDLTMPMLDGLGLLEELKRMQTGTEVILATGFGTVEVAVYAMQQGAVDFMLKPFDLDGLIVRIEKIMSDPKPCCQCPDHAAIGHQERRHGR